MEHPTEEARMDDFSSLRICPDCDCRICFESAAEPLAPDCWLVVIQCPNCWNAWTQTVGDVTLELFENALDDDTRVIEVAVEKLVIAVAVAESEEREEEIGRFAAALAADAIWPMDF
jgi:hypothetical protein